MCEAKPGVRCAADTRAKAHEALDAYRAAFPDGPEVNPLASAVVGMDERTALQVHADDAALAVSSAELDVEFAQRDLVEARTALRTARRGGATPDEVAAHEATLAEATSNAERARTGLRQATDRAEDLRLATRGSQPMVTLGGAPMRASDVNAAAVKRHEEILHAASVEALDARMDVQICDGIRSNLAREHQEALDKGLPAAEVASRQGMLKMAEANARMADAHAGRMEREYALLVAERDVLTKALAQNEALSAA